MAGEYHVDQFQQFASLTQILLAQTKIPLAGSCSLIHCIALPRGGSALKRPDDDAGQLSDIRQPMAVRSNASHQSYGITSAMVSPRLTNRTERCIPSPTLRKD